MSLEMTVAFGKKVSGPGLVVPPLKKRNHGLFSTTLRWPGKGGLKTYSGTRLSSGFQLGHRPVEIRGLLDHDLGGGRVPRRV